MPVSPENQNRPGLNSAMKSLAFLLAMHLGILFVVDFADRTFGMVMIHDRWH